MPSFYEDRDEKFEDDKDYTTEDVAILFKRVFYVGKDLYEFGKHLRKQLKSEKSSLSIGMGRVETVDDAGP